MIGEPFLNEEKKVAVTIIIATFNSEKTLRQALASVRDQTFQNWECIIVDGASKDGTIGIVKEFAGADSRFRYISEPDHGVYYAFNKGWKIAKGEWIHYLGSDDVLTENGINDLMKHEDAAIDVLNGHCYVKKIDGTIKPCFSNGMWGCHQGKLTRRSILEKYGGFDSTYKILADADLMSRLSADGIAVKIVDTFVATFSMGGISQDFKGIIKRLRERIRLCKPRSRTRDITNAFYSFIKEILSIIYRKSLSKLNVQKTCEHS